MFLFLSGCVAPQPALGPRLDEILDRLAPTGATFTARFITLPERRELYARDANAPYIPASNMKVPVSAAGLDVFGGQHVFCTWLVLDGDDLWIVGSGDPGLGDPRLAKKHGDTVTGVFDRWADALAARGITAIAGDLVYYDAALDAEWTHASWGDSVLHWYGAPVSGLGFNDNCFDFTIVPTQPGQLADWELVPPAANLYVFNECVTAEAHAPTIEKLPGGNVYRLRGTCAKREELKSKPVEDPGEFTADALRTHLATRGIEIAGVTRRSETPPDDCLPPPAEQVVASHGTPLTEVLGRINTNSQNFFAEALCKLTGQAWAARQGRHVPGSWGEGALAVREFLKRNGIDDSGFRLVDGSGLSQQNRVTARMMTDLFAVMHARPDAAVFLDSLAKGGVNGTLETRFADSIGHVFAKTGEIGGVRALSGYIRTKSDRWVAFSIIYNRIPGDVKPYEALQDEAVKLVIAER